MVRGAEAFRSVEGNIAGIVLVRCRRAPRCQTVSRARREAARRKRRMGEHQERTPRRDRAGAGQRPGSRLLHVAGTPGLGEEGRNVTFESRAGRLRRWRCSSMELRARGEAELRAAARERATGGHAGGGDRTVEQHTRVQPGLAAGRSSADGAGARGRPRRESLARDWGPEHEAGLGIGGRLEGPRRRLRAQDRRDAARHRKRRPRPRTPHRAHNVGALVADAGCSREGTRDEGDALVPNRSPRDSIEAPAKDSSRQIPY